MTLSRILVAIRLTLAAALALSASATMAAADTPGVSAALSAAPPYTCVTNYYVSATTGNDSNPGTQALPWLTIQNADNGWPNTPTAGECINVMPGTYKITRPLILNHGGNSNTPTGYVVYRSTVPQQAHIVAESGLNTNSNGDVVMVGAGYMIFDGFNIDGNHSLAMGHGLDGCVFGGQPYGIAHHFMALNNVIHDMGGAGLSSCTADFITWSHNVVYNTSSTNPYQSSGMSVWRPQALAAGSYTPTAADNVTYGIVLEYNQVYNNGEGPSIPFPHTDGNGIIIDTTLNSDACSTCGTPYPGTILVMGNTSYGNGGGGIHVFLSQNVIVANNTVYNNYRDPLNPGFTRGELSNGASVNITFLNNIAIAVPGTGYLASNTPIYSFPLTGFPDSGTWTKNIAFGAPVVSDSTSYADPSTNMLGVNPMLSNPAAGKFKPLYGSPAIDAGLPEPYLSDPTPNIGAY